VSDRVSANVCPGCNRPLPAAVVSGPAQAVVRCEGCQTLLLWSNGRVMRSAKSTTGTMMGMPAVVVPTTGAARPAPATTAPPPRAPRESEAPLPELKPEADAAPTPPKTPPPRPVPPKTPPPRTATQPLARLATPKQGVTGIGDNVPTKVAAPPPELRKEAARKDPTPPPMKVPPSGPVKLPPPAPMKVAPSGPNKIATPPAAKAQPPKAEAPKTEAPKAEPPKGEPGKGEAPHVVAAVAQVPQMSDGDMVDPSAWFAGDVSEVVPPAVESGKPPRNDQTGAAPLPPPPSLPSPEAVPFEIEAPGNELTPAMGTMMPEARPQDSAPIAVGREPSQKIQTREPSQKIQTREPSQSIATGKKSATSIRGADPQVPPLSSARTDLPGARTSVGKAPEAPLRSTMIGRAAPEPPRATPTPAPTPPPTRTPPRGEPVAAAVSMLPPAASAAPVVSSTSAERADTTPVKAHVAVNAPTAPVEREVSAEALPPPPAGQRMDTTAETMLQPETRRVPLQVSRRLLFIVGGGTAGVLALVFIVIAMSHGPKRPAGTTSSVGKTVAPATPAVEAPRPTAPTATPTPTTPAPTTAAPPATAPTPPPTVAEPTPTTPPPDGPVTPAPPRPRRTLGGKKIVLEYDPKPTSPTPPAAQAATPMGEDPATVARAREAYHKGNVKLFAGDSAGAIALYRESLKIYPGYVAGYRGLGLGYEAAGNADEALKAFHTYVRTVPSANDTPIIRRRIDRLESQKSGGASPQ
jgi:hypothetical protein